MDSIITVLYSFTMDTIVIWLGSLAILLNKLWGTIFRPEKFNCTFEETVKRYGVYYMCIDDLPI